MKNNDPVIRGLSHVSRAGVTRLDRLRRNTSRRNRGDPYTSVRLVLWAYFPAGRS